MFLILIISYYLDPFYAERAHVIVGSIVVVLWISMSPRKPRIVISIPGFSSLKDET